MWVMIMITEFLLTLLALSPLLFIKERKYFVAEKQYTEKELRHIKQQMIDCDYFYNRQRNSKE